MSHHFSVLKAADLILSRRRGQQIVYSLNTTVMQDVLAIVWDLFAEKERTKRARGPRSRLSPEKAS